MCACVCLLGLKGITAAQPQHAVTVFFALLLVLEIMSSFCLRDIRTGLQPPSVARCVLTEGVK